MNHGAAVQVIVKLRSAAPAAGAAATGAEGGRAANRGREAIRAVAREYGAQTRPLHPGTPDAELARYHVVDLPDPRRAGALIAALLKSPLVDGAYAKPSDALP